LNQKSGKLPFFFEGNQEVIDKFINGDSKLIKFIKFLMKTNDTKPLINYRTSKRNYQNHIYMSVFVDNKKYIYIGKAKESTRYRWGYGSGHLFEVFHYITKGGKYNLPRQLTDLFTLYLGPSRQVVFTLETDVLDIKLDDYEKGYQYFFHFHGKELGITKSLNDKLKDTISEKYEHVYKLILENYKKYTVITKK
jgi:hypothetical protein